MHLTWLNLRVKATTFGAELCFSFLFQPQLDSSWKHTNNQGNWYYALSHSTFLYTPAFLLNVFNSLVRGHTLCGKWRGGRKQDMMGEKSRWGGRKREKLRTRSSQRLRQINGWPSNKIIWVMGPPSVCISSSRDRPFSQTTFWVAIAGKPQV